MIQFDDLTDSEWTLIEGLFCNEVVPPERSGRRCAVGPIDGAWLVQSARMVSVAPDLPPSL
jgi:hypothetical protein